MPLEHNNFWKHFSSEDETYRNRLFGGENGTAYKRFFSQHEREVKALGELVKAQSEMNSIVVAQMRRGDGLTTKAEGERLAQLDQVIDTQLNPALNAILNMMAKEGLDTSELWH